MFVFLNVLEIIFFNKNVPKRYCLTKILSEIWRKNCTFSGMRDQFSEHFDNPLYIVK